MSVNKCMFCLPDEWPKNELLVAVAISELVNTLRGQAGIPRARKTNQDSVKLAMTNHNSLFLTWFMYYVIIFFITGLWSTLTGLRSPREFYCQVRIWTKICPPWKKHCEQFSSALTEIFTVCFFFNFFGSIWATTTSGHFAASILQNKNKHLKSGTLSNF